MVHAAFCILAAFDAYYNEMKENDMIVVVLFNQHDLSTCRFWICGELKPQN